MHRLPILCAALVAASPAAAQVADTLSRGLSPNAIDRSLSRAPASDTVRNRIEADRSRADQAARDAAARRGPLPNSTMTDGPSGVQRTGSSAVPPAPAATPASPIIPQP